MSFLKTILDKVFQLKKYRNLDENDLRQLLYQEKFKSEVIDSTIQHEKAHFEKAKQLGYNPTYDAVVFKNLFGIYIDCRVEHEQATKSDLLKIALAPENPSIEDLSKLNL